MSLLGMKNGNEHLLVRLVSGLKLRNPYAGGSTRHEATHTTKNIIKLVFLRTRECHEGSVL